MNVSFVNRKLTGIVYELDIDGARDSISYEEFNEIMRNQEAVLTLREVGVDPEGLIDFADFIFQGQEDENQDRRLNGEVEEPVALSLEEFISIVLQFRGSNSATVKDMVDLRKFVTKSLSQFEKNFRLVSSEAEKILEKKAKPKPEILRKDLQLGCARLEAFLSTMLTEVEANGNLTSLLFNHPLETSAAQDLRACSERLDEFSSFALGELNNLRSLLPVKMHVLQKGGGGTKSLSERHFERLEQEEQHSKQLRLRQKLAELEEFLLTSLSSSVQEFSRSCENLVDESSPIRSGPMPFDAHLATRLKELVSQFHSLRRSL